MALGGAWVPLLCPRSAGAGLGASASGPLLRLELRPRGTRRRQHIHTQPYDASRTRCPRRVRGPARATSRADARPRCLRRSRGGRRGRPSCTAGSRRSRGRGPVRRGSRPRPGRGICCRPGAHESLRYRLGQCHPVPPLRALSGAARASQNRACGRSPFSPGNRGLLLRPFAAPTEPTSLKPITSHQLLDEPLHSCNKSIISVGNHWSMDKSNLHSLRELDAATGLVFGALFGALLWIAGVLALIGLMILAG